MCPPGHADGLQAQGKAAEAKTHPAVGSGGAAACLAGEISHADLAKPTLNAEPHGERAFGSLLVCFSPVQGGERRGGCVCKGLFWVMMHLSGVTHLRDMTGAGQ